MPDILSSLPPGAHLPIPLRIRRFLPVPTQNAEHASRRTARHSEYPDARPQKGRVLSPVQVGQIQRGQKVLAGNETSGANINMMVGYARVSTGEQKLGLQLDALNGAGCLRVFRDEGVSGSAVNRPGLNDALRAVRRGDVLVVWKLDRLGRSLPHLIDVISGLAKRGVGFRSLSESIDTTTASGKLFFHIMGALAEFERSLISERTIAGMAAARRRGVHVGRPRKLNRQQAEEVMRLVSQGDKDAKSMALQYGVSSKTISREISRAKRRTA